MSFGKRLSSIADVAWFHARRLVLQLRAGRYRRFAMSDEIRVGEDVIIRRERRDMAFEKKVLEFNHRYRKYAPEGAVYVSVNLHPNRIGDTEPRRTFSFLTFFSFDFKDTLTVTKGTRKVVVDRTSGLSVYGNMKADLLEGEVGDFYRQTVLTVAVTKGQVKPESAGPSQAEPPLEIPEKQPEPEVVEIVLDPEAVAREHDRFMGNVDKIEKAINGGTDDDPVVLEEYERKLVDSLLSSPDNKASRQDLQAVLTPYRKRVALVANSVNEKCYDALREPLIVQEDDEFRLDVSYYNIIFGDGR